MTMAYLCISSWDRAHGRVLDWMLILVQIFGLDLECGVWGVESHIA